MDRRIQVFVVNHQPVMRHGLAAMLQALPALRWVGEAGDIAAALRGIAAQSAALEPDVVLLELPPDGAAAQAVGALRQRLPDIACVLVSDSVDAATVRRALAAGASGCLPRDADVEGLQAAVEAAHAGRAPAGDGGAAAGADPPDGSDLTPREAELLGLMARGLSNAEIAADLAIALPTVKFHVAHILAKLQADNRTEAVLIALRHRLVRLD